MRQDPANSVALFKLMSFDPTDGALTLYHYMTAAGGKVKGLAHGISLQQQLLNLWHERIWRMKGQDAQVRQIIRSHLGPET